MAKSKRPQKKQTRKVAPFETTRWTEMDRSFENFRRYIERSFASFPSISFPRFPKMPETSCDIIDEGKQFRVKMNVPGVSKNEIDLNVTENSIEVSAEHKEEEEEEKKRNYLHKERSQISYYRTISLTQQVISSKAQAKLKDGILEITLPKSKPTPKPKKKSISVQ